ncbi:MAG TPA: hypothetical protein VEZ71_31935 [Archangium sp.]|nr:hypothetical protein [Archangium sp.]
MSARVVVLVLCLLGVSSALAQFVPPVGRATSTADVLSTVADAGTLLQADEDAYANTFVAKNMAPDGGTAKYSFISTTDSCMKLGAGSQAEFCAVGNTISFNTGEVQIPTLRITQPACPSSGSCRWFSDNWAPGAVPRSSLPACGTNQAGGIVALSTDGNRHYLCDGSAAQRFGVALVATASVDFASMADGAESSATLTLTGAATTDVVHCSPLAAPESGLDVRYFMVSAANTVTLAVRNRSGGVLDPVSISWKCAVTR